jgi:hypothetical protein
VLVTDKPKSYTATKRNHKTAADFRSARARAFAAWAEVTGLSGGA